MATEAILVDVGMLYKRLFNHRPLIQNEVNYFVKEFETKREDNDLKIIQDAMLKSDEINNVFLNEIVCSNPHFKNIGEKIKAIKDACEEVLNNDVDLGISQEDQNELDKQVEEYRLQLKQKEQEIFATNEQDVVKLKEEIEELRESRQKMRSVASSVSSSITTYPPATTPSPQEMEEDKQTALGEDGAEAEDRERSDEKAEVETEHQS